MIRLNHLAKLSFLFLIWIGLSACTRTVLPSESASDQTIITDQSQAFAEKFDQKYDLDPALVEAAFAQARYQEKIISIMNRPFEAQTWAVYQRHMLTPKRIAEGKVFAKRYQDVLAKTQRRMGVPSELIVAIIGVETLYGKNQGNYYVLDALTTLSFGYPKRAAFFQSELANYLRLCQDNHWPVRQLKGSYAGAFGMGQFMPSSYRQYALSMDHNPADLSNDPQAAILSVANYFAKHGWHTGQPVAVSVQVPTALKTPCLPKMNKAKHDVAYWQRLGVRVPPSISNGPAELVVVLDANGQYRSWLIFPNFYVIARYNPSLNYSLSVFLLSEAI